MYDGLQVFNTLSICHRIDLCLHTVILGNSMI